MIQAAHANPLVERNLLSSDGSVIGINVYLDMHGYQRGFDERVAAVSWRITWAPPTQYLSIYPLMVGGAHPILKGFYNDRVKIRQ